MNSRFLTALAILTTAAAVEAQTPRAVFLLDRSGSMTLGGAPNRCDASAIACQGDISAFFSAFPNGEISVREFNDVIPTGSRAVPGFNEWMSASSEGSLASAVTNGQNAVSASVMCAGLTPLADAICDSASALLIRGIIDPSAECFFYVYSDGGENNSMGACSGEYATNSDTGRCSFDTFATGMPYETGPGGMPSWQQNSCAQIEALSLSCGLVLNVYKFNGFSIVGDPALSFLDSASRGTGGFSINVADGTVPAPGGIQSFRDGCADSSGLRPLLQPLGTPTLGSNVNLVLQAGNYQRFILLGFNEIDPGIDLGLVGSPGCVLTVDAAVTVGTGLFPLIIPQNGALVGVTLETQGVGLGTLPSQAPVLTSNRIRLNIAP
ncbi:MAG: hypothetical protein AAF196_08630 [Planctomycetota bacterium]